MYWKMMSGLLFVIHMNQKLKQELFLQQGKESNRLGRSDPMTSARLSAAWERNIRETAISKIQEWKILI